MISVDRSNRKGLSRLFQGYPWNCLPDSILDGHMGEALVDSEENPQVAVLILPKLKLFIPGGDAGHPSARETIQNLPRVSALIFASEGWEALVQEIHTGKLITMTRYAFTSEKLDLGHLRQLASQIPVGYRLVPMDLRLAQRLASEKSGFASDHMVNFDSLEDFIGRGFGFCILAGDEIVSAATTFAICNKGIEIQVDTREKHRRKGLATVVAAQMLIHSLQNNLDPNWDADNEVSVGLARKLGYTPQGTYSIVLVVGSRPMAIFVKAALRIKQFFKQ